MMGRLKSEQDQLFSSTLKMRCQTITSFGGSILLSICPGFAAN